MTERTQLLIDYHNRLVVAITDEIKSNSYKVLEFDSPQTYQAQQLALIKALDKIVDYLKI